MHMFLWGYCLRLSPFWNNHSSWRLSTSALGLSAMEVKRPFAGRPKQCKASASSLCPTSPGGEIGIAQSLLLDEEPRSSVSSMSTLNSFHCIEKKESSKCAYLITFEFVFKIINFQPRCSRVLSLFNH